MTQRDRQTPDGGAQAPPRLVADRPSANGASSWWEDLFLGIPVPRQQELLALAERQGLLYAHQIGPTPAASARRPLLPSLLNGQLADLDPLQPPAVESHDPHLDETQREAVTRALHTPDVCLIQGQPGTGKSRVVAEIIAHATARGERVLLLAPGVAALDCVLERIGSVESVCPVRCLAVDERPEALPACIRRLTFAERLRRFEEQILGTARREHEESQQLCASRQRDETVWPRLEATLERITRLDDESKALANRREGIAGEVLTDAGPGAEANTSAFHVALAATAGRRAEAVTRIENRLTEVRAEIAKIRADMQRLDGEATPLLPMAEAKRAGKWWTGAWWRATFRGDVVGQVEQLQKQIEELKPTETRRTKEADDLAAERKGFEEQARTERDEAVRVETNRRLDELDARAVALNAERSQAEAEWQSFCHELADASLVPTAPEMAALRTSRNEWERRLKQDLERQEIAAQWLAGLEQALPGLPERLARCANVVAATPRTLALDSQFGESSAPPVTFDLLIMEEADQFTEADFLQAARRTHRWVLIGEPQPDPDAALPRSHHGRGLRPNALRPGFFQRLWRNLRWDPSRLPYAWEQRDELVHCRLRHVAPEQETWVQTERLADRPDVDLHILSRPRQEPELVEVVFPASTSVPEAKEYLFRELGEVTLQAASSDWYWAETAERVVLRLTPIADPNAVLVPLCVGVRELVAPSAGDENDETAEWRTCAVEFDRAEGWDGAHARSWAEEHLRMRDTGRTTLLTATHRTHPVLAAWVAHLLHGQATPTSGAVCEPAFEFVAVPSLELMSERGPAPRSGNGRSRESGGAGSVSGAAVATKLRPVKGGAGLETDLADSRRIDQMPADLRASLPPRGVVNFLEAQALVRCLEGLLADEAFRTAAERWQQSQAHPCEQNGALCTSRSTPVRSAHCPAVAVMALYPAQADLINRLLQRVPALLASSVTVEVGSPSAFRHRECLTALVSLTRSHTHRAVPYGDGPQTLALALTRAAERMIVFGDPGTLARRSHWQGALDHLDETAGERERALAARIIGVLQRTESIPPGFRLREGTIV